MPFQLGTPELVITLVIIILLFGAGRISKIARELGGGIRSFRQGLTEDKLEEQLEDNKETH